jgi:phage-related protein (TIGR01555 family)
MGNVLQLATARVADTLSNVVSGLGIFGKDKKTSNFFSTFELSQDQLEMAYRGDWIARKVVDQVVGDMTREWRSWNGTKSQIEKLENEERRLGYRAKVARAKKLARLYGGAVIVVGDGSPDPTQPLDPERIGLGGLKFMHVLHRWEITPGQIDRDPMSPYFGEPKGYQLSTGTGTAVTIHPSRVQRFIGREVPNHNRAQTQGWGDSELQALFDAVKAAASTQENIASLIEEARLDIIKIPGLMEQVATAEYEARLTKRLTVAAVGKSNLNTLVMDGAEEWDQRQLSFSGMPEIIRCYLDIAAGSAGYPVALFLGVSPGGLNATGAADIRGYYDRVSSEQNTDLRPNIERLDEMLIRSALGRRPAGVHYQWNSLWQMTDAEKADNGLKKAQATNLYGRLGVMSRQALASASQSQLLEDGLYPGLDDILKLPGATVPSPPIGGKTDNGPPDKPNPTADKQPDLFEA